MKLQLKNIIALAAIALVLTSCTKDSATENISGVGALSLEFDSVFKTADFIHGTPYTNSNGEVIKIDSLKYIVSNVVLTKADGSTYVVPKNQSYVIVDEFKPNTDEGTTALELPNIPAGNYVKVQFGIGVDQDQYNLGSNAQGTLMTTAKTAGMLPSWDAGYTFVDFEGTFTKPGTVDTDTAFKVNIGKTTTNYNYTTVTLNLPINALVRTTISPEVHMFVDLSKIIDGTNKINLTDGATITDGSKVDLITGNIASMFTVSHVHNDPK